MKSNLKSDLCKCISDDLICDYFKLQIQEKYYVDKTSSN